jgi:predicted transglutaminase-like cysteine proteinase
MGGPQSRPRSTNVVVMISKVLSAKSGIVFIAALAASAIDALPAVAGPERLAHVVVSEVTKPPPGWVEFCVRQPGECAGTTTTPQNPALSPKAWRELVQVNKWVNETIKPLTDLEHWGVVERWSYPDDGYGDCEDYALLKRRVLIESGWPREALLLTVVRGKDEEAHAVLTVTTDKGDYVLDNISPDILLWSRTGYRFVKRQSQYGPNTWVSLGDSASATATATSP